MEAGNQEEFPQKHATISKYEMLLERANNELGADLWLIAERIILYRLTRAGELKGKELAMLARAIREIISETEGKKAIPPELAQLSGESSDQGELGKKWQQRQRREADSGLYNHRGRRGENEF